MIRNRSHGASGQGMMRKRYCTMAGETRRLNERLANEADTAMLIKYVKGQ